MAAPAYYEMSDGVYRSSETSTNYLEGVEAGTLTAGEQNDFGKWNLWTDIAENDLKKHQDEWKIYPLERFTVQVINSKNNPVIDCSVELLNDMGKTLWLAKTDNTGKAELWDNLFKQDSIEKVRNLRITYKDQVEELKNVKPAPETINIVKINAQCEIPMKADVLFVVDATGSMADEIKYLQAELLDILTRINATFQNIELKNGSVFYRDQNEEYVTRVSDLTCYSTKTLNFIKEQRATGGGDFPEAVDDALEASLEKINWSKDARARLMFLILDAPPHQEKENIEKVKKYTQMAAAEGVKIIPITASGIDKSTEYLMRSLALATNGTYVFLTDHSGVGNPHIQPTTDSYDVEKLNDLIYRLLLQNLTVTPCNETDQPIAEFDTVFVSNIIDHVVLDSQNIAEKQETEIDTFEFENNQDSFIEDDIVVEDSTETDTSDIADIVDKPEPKSIKIYPNPTSGKLTIEISGSIEEIYLADMSGKLLEKHNTANQERLDLNISQYPNGIYLVQFNDGERWCSGKVVLRR
jgi:hypothetical protein